MYRAIAAVFAANHSVLQQDVLLPATHLECCRQSARSRRSAAGRSSLPRCPGTSTRQSPADAPELHKARNNIGNKMLHMAEQGSSRAGSVSNWTPASRPTMQTLDATLLKQAHTTVGYLMDA